MCRAQLPPPAGFFDLFSAPFIANHFTMIYVEVNSTVKGYRFVLSEHISRFPRQRQEERLLWVLSVVFCAGGRSPTWAGPCDQRTTQEFWEILEDESGNRTIL